MKPIKQIIKDENIKSLTELLEKHPEVWVNHEIASTGSVDDRTCGCIIQVSLAAQEILPGSWLSILQRTCYKLHGPNTVVATWNDSPERTVQNIIELIRKAGL